VSDESHRKQVGGSQKTFTPTYGVQAFGSEKTPELYTIIKISRKIGLFLGDYRVLLPDFYLNTAGKQGDCV